MKFANEHFDEIKAGTVLIYINEDDEFTRGAEYTVQEDAEGLFIVDDGRFEQFFNGVLANYFVVKETTNKQEADELIRTLIKGEECNPCEWCHTPDNTDNGGVCEGCCLYEDNDDLPCKFTAFSHKPDKNI